MRRSESGSWINYCQPWLRHKESLPFVKKCSVSDYVIKEQGVIKGLVKKYFYLCNGTFFYLRRLKYTFLLKEMVTFIQCNIQLHTLDGTRNLPLTEEGGGVQRENKKRLKRCHFSKWFRHPPIAAIIPDWSISYRTVDGVHLRIVKSQGCPQFMIRFFI